MSAKCVCANCDSRSRTFKMVRLVRQFVQNKMVKFPKKIDYFLSISDLNQSLLENKITHGKFTRVYKKL